LADTKLHLVAVDLTSCLHWTWWFDRSASNAVDSPWNRLDFLIVVVAYVEVIGTAVGGSDSIPNIRILRALRVLRSLKVVNSIPSLQ
jgi:hypothetical protein